MIRSANIPPVTVDSGQESRQIKAADQLQQPPIPDVRVNEPKEEAQISLEEIVENVNEISRELSTDLSFSIDEELDMVIVTITRPESEPGVEEAVVRQIPPEGMVDLAKRLSELRDDGEARELMLMADAVSQK